MLGHTQEITCTELELLVYLVEHIFLWDLKEHSGSCQMRPAGFGRNMNLTRRSLKSYNKWLLTSPLLRYNKHNM